DVCSSDLHAYRCPHVGVPSVSTSGSTEAVSIAIAPAPPAFLLVRSWPYGRIYPRSGYFGRGFSPLAPSRCCGAARVSVRRQKPQYLSLPPPHMLLSHPTCPILRTWSGRDVGASG